MSETDCNSGFRLVDTRNCGTKCIYQRTSQGSTVHTTWQMLTPVSRRLSIYLTTNARFRPEQVTTSAPRLAILLGLSIWIQWVDFKCLDGCPPTAPFGLIKTLPSLLNTCWRLQKAVKHHCSAWWPWTTSTGALLLRKTHVVLSLLIYQ